MEKNEYSKITMKDVAAKAGVTIGTVSHVINATAPISYETKKKVLRVIKELGYIPNPMARYMRSKKSHMIGFLIPNINNYFHSNIARTFIDEAGKEDYSVLILGYNYSLEGEKRAIESLLQYNVETIIIANGYDDESYIRRILDQNVPVILVDRSTILESACYIQYDNKKVIFEAVSMLKKKGYKSIGFFSEPLRLINLEDRYKSYVQAMKENGYIFNANHVFISDKLCLDNIKNGYLYMKELLKDYPKEALPQAFIASCDLTAVGMMRAINEFNYRVPEDFGIIGCDNIDLSGYTRPRLTTINQDQVLMGKELWKMAKAVISREKVENVTLNQELIIRESC